MNKIFTTTSQKELKAQYRVLMADVWEDERMIDFCTKNADVIIKFANGFVAEIEKPSIKTHFCFGYRLSSHDTEEFDNACDMAVYARKSEEYFKEKNLEDLKRTIKNIEECRFTPYFRNHYCSQKNDILKGIEWFEYYNEPVSNPEYVKLTEADKALLLEAYKVELERFSKRVDTYLKKYGTSKVKSWSYWQDA